MRKAKLPRNINNLNDLLQHDEIMEVCQSLIKNRAVIQDALLIIRDINGRVVIKSNGLDDDTMIALIERAKVELLFDDD